MKKFILFAIIITLLIPIGSAAETKYGELDVLYTIMDDLGADYLQEDIIFNGVILNRFIKIDEMEIIGKDLISNLKLLGTEIDPLISESHNEKFYTKEIIVEENFGQICYIGQDKDKNNISIILNSYRHEEELIGETYLYVNIVKSSDFLKKNDIIEEIKSIYEMYNSKVEITSCLIGEISNDLNSDNKIKNIKKSLKRIDGEVIEEFSDESMISYTIYTPYIDQYIKIGSDRINLNIAIRYNETENKHYIWLGTPIITVGY
ncbi:MAG: YwmB family TATA-box binding protein [Tissierellaceae bacterium]|nr:YwmB family TATA-box binding protein [Tissierellaceae bacterium]